MVWTDPQIDTDSRRAYVRALVGDTDPADPQISDELLAPFLSKQTNDDLVGWRVCLYLVGHYAREAASSLGPLKEASQERVQNYTLLAAELWRAGMGLGPVGQEGTLGNDPGLRFAGARAIDNGVNVPSYFTRTIPS